jgi:Fe-S oxidoreductase
MSKAIKECGNIFGEKRVIPPSLKSYLTRLPEESNTLLFLGCVSSFRYINHAECLIRCLLEADYSFIVFRDETCCGGPFEFFGMYKQFQHTVHGLLQKVRDRRIKRIITICPLCYTVFKEHYEGEGIEVLHIVEVLGKLIENGRIDLRKEVPLRVTYHDPCHLGRYAKIFYTPRKILQSIPGLTFKEMERTREQSLCCGGPIRIPFVKIRNTLCEAILEEARKVKASGIVTACPTCFHNLYVVSIKEIILDLVEIIAFSAGIIDNIPIYRKF